MDSSIDSDSSSDSGTESDLPVTLDSLGVDGTLPKAGDSVEVTVKGTISKIVNGTAFVSPETVNGQPMPEAPNEPTDDELMTAAGKMDAGMMG